MPPRPNLHRLHTPHDASDALGNVSVIVSLYSFRMNIAPPVATRLLPVVFDSVQITRAKNLGTLVHAAGHWVSATVTERTSETGPGFVGSHAGTALTRL